MTKTKYETVNLPLDQMPKGRGWEIVTGNVTHNLWRRARPKKRGMTGEQLINRIIKRAHARA